MKRWLLALTLLLAAVPCVRGQTPTPTPVPDELDKAQISCNWVTAAAITASTAESWASEATAPCRTIITDGVKLVYATIQAGSAATTSTVILEVKGCKLCDWVAYPPVTQAPITDISCTTSGTQTSCSRTFSVAGIYSARWHPLTLSSGTLLGLIRAATP
jgi:hypothetical protein